MLGKIALFVAALGVGLWASLAVFAVDDDLRLPPVEVAPAAEMLTPPAAVAAPAVEPEAIASSGSALDEELADAAALAGVDGGAAAAAAAAAIDAEIEWTAAADPEAALLAAAAMPGDTGVKLRRRALGILAEVDPQRAIAELFALPRNREWSALLAAVATGFATADPQGALRWARTLEAGERPTAFRGVIEMASSRDIEAAASVLLDPPAGENVALSRFAVLSERGLGSDPEKLRRLADRLLQAESVHGRESLASALTGWSTNDAEGMLAWLAANEGKLDGSVVNELMESKAIANPRAAADFVERLPRSLQSAAIVQVARPLVVSELGGALVWVARYRDLPGYAAAHREIILQAAAINPVAAGAWLRDASDEVKLGTVAEVAARWAVRDRAAAERWADSLPQGPIRDQALGALTGSE
jgi:hypothetical protein